MQEQRRDDLPRAHKNSCRLRHVTARSTSPKTGDSHVRAPVHPAGEVECRGNLSPLKFPAASPRAASARLNSFFSDVPSVRVSRAAEVAVHVARSRRTRLSRATADAGGRGETDGEREKLARQTHRLRKTHGAELQENQGREGGPACCWRRGSGVTPRL